ncbi:1,2-dihydroxy-3-keto-5-methylthiopentene dioxygenase [Hyalangium minutum]|uniref:Acireductone dioxygenase n=1 Tax=Hyalangium minutum TaxID=394096 RepID=A0A085W6A7_9BACT|nr:cupin domain-containing protein [Hyalangium minutum]KFE63220.1 1,2-dihydroxy-3-keto-5-methylthiopentene dioxygenase [Hyalangium minutum]
MSELKVYPDHDSSQTSVYTDFASIQRELGAAGIRFERWAANRPLSPDAGEADILAAYRDSVDRLMAEKGFRSVDVIKMVPDHPKSEELRNKFLSEHTHSEDEVRFFVEGQGLFNIHRQGKVFAVRCEKGDLIGVPDGTPHWFDMGPRPHFIAIRLFTNTEGWVAHFTGNDIATRFPYLAA